TLSGSGAASGAAGPVSHRIFQSTPNASLSASRMTSELRCSPSRLASGADSWLSTSVSPSTARTIAPASITSVVRLRWRTLSRTVVHMLRTAAALGSPPAEGAVGAGASTTGSAGGSTGGGEGGGSGAGSDLGAGGGSGAGSASASGAGGGSGALLLRANCFG